MIKIFKVADIRKLDQQCMRGEISYSRKVELINEFANEVISKVEKLPIHNVSSSFCSKCGREKATLHYVNAPNLEVCLNESCEKIGS